MLLVVLAPLPLGSGRPLAWQAIGLAVGAMLLGLLPISFAEFGAFRRDMPIPASLLGAVLLFVGLQCTSVTPTSWHHPIWQEASQGLNRDLAGAISIDPETGRIYLLRLLSYVGIFLLALATTRNPRRAGRAIKAVTLAGGLYAAYGLVVYWSGNATLLWFHKWTYLEDLTGTFVNHNSFATYLGLCTLAAFACLGEGLDHLRFYGDRTDKIRIAIEFISARWWILGLIFLLMTALVLTHSRAGLATTAAGMLVLFMAVALAPSFRRFSRAGLATVPLTILTLAFFVSGEKTAERLIQAGHEGQERVEVYRLTQQAIGDHPALGTGLGSFYAAFPHYRSTEVRSYFDLAHNDFLQNALELGIPASLCLFTVLLWMAALCIRGTRMRHRDALFSALGLAATVQVGLHAMVDFSLQIPAVTGTYALLLGIAVAQSRSVRQTD
jgi:O-antigen ligase